MRELSDHKALFEHERLDQSVFSYISSRQNPDGGYTFVQENDSNAQDTFYGLATLKLLNRKFPRREATVEWLRHFKLCSVYSYYYVGKALALCGEDLDRNFNKHVASIIAAKRYFGSVDVYIEVASEFQVTHMVLELAELANLKKPGPEVADWVLKFKNSDGGFGSYGYSNINSTYFATASLSLLSFAGNALKDTVNFVRECENSNGGFTVIPNSYGPYIEHTYYGLMALETLREKCRFQRETIDFVLSCQNANGGFARTDLGISTFENTFQAITLLQTLTTENQPKKSLS